MMQTIQVEFPILQTKVKGKDLIYLDNAATTQKPKQVIKKITEYYEQTNSNVHRGIHTLSEKATVEYEKARAKVAKFINAHPKEVVFTKGTTESINLLASTIELSEDDEVLVSAMEHHANLVPWQNTKARVKIIPLKEDGTLNEQAFQELVSEKTKVVSIVHISNVLGTINDIKKIIQQAKKVGAISIIDGAQAAGHISIDVKELDCDAYAFSAHKMYGPTGTGILFAKEQLLNTLKPYQFGGEMIDEVTYHSATYNDIPWKFEAGTPNIAGAIGLGAAIDFINEQGVENMQKAEEEITRYAYEKLKEIEGLTILGPKNRGALIAFTLQGCHPHDIAALLDEQGIAVRAGHHCAMPLAKLLKIDASTRMSFACYTKKEEIDKAVTEIKKVKEVLK